jgi:DNA-binding response OmpR family regulator
MAMTFAEPIVPQSGVLSLGNFHVNLDTFDVAIDGTRVRLTYQEFEVLRRLLSEVDKIVPFELLTDYLWHASGHSFNRRLNVLVHRLRLKLTGSFPYQVEAVRLRGYGLLSRQLGD